MYCLKGYCCLFDACNALKKLRASSPFKFTDIRIYKRSKKSNGEGLFSPKMIALLCQCWGTCCTPSKYVPREHLLWPESQFCVNFVRTQQHRVKTILRAWQILRQL